ncbi:DUF2491 family protein [Serratia microhaemolytica]|uniref:DUF2491 family protein n=1 Tax=Serratia microhaemolytica TaxID=2675110 RepID=UPI000FDE7646|nr:DUF2491 family protein [Serratia microhaemolytica]
MKQIFGFLRQIVGEISDRSKTSSSAINSTNPRGPLGLHLSAGFTLDTLEFRLLNEQLLLKLPGEQFIIAAVGEIDLGNGSRIFRYYTTGDEFLQINTTGGSEINDIEDIKLFIYQDSSAISQEKNWLATIAPSSIGTETLRWQQQRWQRMFNRDEAGSIEPIYMLETVINQDNEQWEVHNFTMGYQRRIVDETYEYLLLNGEETFNQRDEPEWLFSRALGVDIPLGSINVIA